MFGGEKLDDDEDAPQGERNQTINERPTEADAADRRRAHPAEEYQLPFVVVRRVRHQRVERNRRLVHGDVVVNHLQSWGKPGLSTYAVRPRQIPIPKSVSKLSAAS